MVRAANLSSAVFSVGQVPQNPDELVRYIADLEARLKIVLDALAAGHLDKTHVEPTKPRDGDIRYADGTNFNPTAGGEGFYGYYAAAWHKLG